MDIRDPNLQPPFGAFMGMKITHLSKDKVEAEMPMREELNNRFGAMHGGAIMALADNLGGTATFANLPRRRAHRNHRKQDQFLCANPGWRRGPRRMHAAAPRPHHDGLADQNHP